MHQHLKEAHEKCTICANGHPNIYYRDYKELAEHFNKTHFACKDEDCIAKGFIAFKFKHQLEDHLYKFHGYPGNSRVIVTSKEDEDKPVELKDTIGIDMTKQVLYNFFYIFYLVFKSEEK